MELVVICRKVESDAGRIEVYPLSMKITPSVVDHLRIRAYHNPELRHFVTTAAHFRGFKDVITDVLKRQTVTREDVARVGGLVEL